MNSISNFFKNKEYNYFEGDELKTKKLNILERFIRFFGYAPETHLLNVVKHEYELKHINFKKDASDNPTDQKILGLIFKANEIYGVNKGEPAFINLKEEAKKNDVDVQQVGYVVKKDSNSKFLLEKIEVKVVTKPKIPGIKAHSSRAIIQIPSTEREDIKVLVNSSQLPFFKNEGKSQSVNTIKKYIADIQRRSGLDSAIEYEAIPRPLKGK